ncbi:MAG: hypothetical protein E6F99_25715 [Actinobacteria bacterium]|nr:MAG: hypothetical protein E6F99_25715 [Actinomycetota bacterium]
MAGRTRAQKGQLAAELTSFVDRRAAMVEVKRLLSTARLVTLTGVGGTGKTRLATQIATACRRTGTCARRSHCSSGSATPSVSARPWRFSA